MGTHNHVMRLGGSLYLEIIAVDPEAPAPERPRWFDLDNPYVRSVLMAGPRIITWVVRTPDLSALSPSDSELFGRPLAMQRDALRWLIMVPDDGHLPGSGFLPTIIQWQSDMPMANMSESGCTLERLVIRHDRDRWLSATIDRLGAGSLVEITSCEDGESRIEAVIQTPRGRISLR